MYNITLRPNLTAGFSRTQLATKALQSVADIAQKRFRETMRSFAPSFVNPVVEAAADLSAPLSTNMQQLLDRYKTSLPSSERDDFVKAFVWSANVNPNFLQACVKNQEAQVKEPHPKEPILDEILTAKYTIPPLPSGLHLQHQEILTKALKIKQYYNQHGYICFLHGQEPSRLILQSLLKEVAKIRNPESHFKNPFVYFRSEQFYEQTKELKYYQIAHDLKKVIYHDNDQRELVISADAYFLSKAFNESANSFCGQTRSASSFKNRGQQDLYPLIAGINMAAKLVIQKEIDDLMAIVSQNMPCGNLCVICVPKDKVMNYSYPARSGGKFCNCSSEQEILQQLIDANNDIEPQCKYEGTTQWRLAAAALRPENGVRSFTLSPHGDLEFFTEEYIKPLAAKIAYLQVKSPTSRL